MTDRTMLVTSRAFEEYVAFFDLEPGGLPGRVIDVSAGASSFVAEASRRGVAALAVDPAYRHPGALRSRARASLSGGNRLIAAHGDRFVHDWYGGPERREGLRRRALEAFLIDHELHPGRYLPAALPGLPVATGSFDLAVSSHLLFTWADVFDERWHLAALVELTRVAREVRVFPLVVQGSGEPVEFLRSLRTRLAAGFGITSSVDPVPYEFQRDARHMLRLARA